MRQRLWTAIAIVVLAMTAISLWVYFGRQPNGSHASERVYVLPDTRQTLPTQSSNRVPTTRTSDSPPLQQQPVTSSVGEPIEQPFQATGDEEATDSAPAQPAAATPGVADDTPADADEAMIARPFRIG